MTDGHTSVECFNDIVVNSTVRSYKGYSSREELWYVELIVLTFTMEFDVR